MATEYCLTYKYTGQTNVHNSMIVAKSKFTLSGDTTKKIGKITRITYHHYHTSTNARTWKLYGKFYFSDETYITSDTVSKEISDNVVNYVNTFTTNLPSPDKFATWKQIQTVAANPSSSIDIYWRATSDYPMYVKVYFEEAGASITDESGNQVSSEIYVWKTTNPTTYYYPPAAMTANSSQGCVASADSTVSSSYPAYQAFSKVRNSWCSADNNNSHWIQLKIPRGLYNIRVRIRNRGDKDYVNGMTSGVIYGLGADGSTLTQLLTISGRDGGSRYHMTEHALNNTTTPYYGIRIKATGIKHYGSDKYLSFGEILVLGTDIGANGNWTEAKPLVWKTENPKTYTYPAAAMTLWNSQDCTALASSELNCSSHPAWKAFNKATGTGDIWFSADTPGPHWLQLIMPRPLYNISVQLYNRFGNDHKGAIDGIIYGSNDNGTTLTQIGSFSGRDPTYGTNSTITCNNSTVAYNTVRVVFTKWGDASGNPVTTSAMGVGAMFVTGTDIGANGGWANVMTKEGQNSLILYPKLPMSGFETQDCSVSASSVYSGTNAFAGFDRDVASGWASIATSTAPQWIQLKMPIPLYKVVVCLFNDTGTIKAPCSGAIYGSIDGSELVQIGSFDNRPSAKGASTTHFCNNTTTGYDTIRIVVNSWYNTSGAVITSGANLDLGEIFIYGTQRP